MLALLKAAVRSTPAMERLARHALDRRYQLARKHLKGIGIEIGALDRPLFLPKQATAYYLDHLLPGDLYAHYPELSNRKFYVSLVADGEDMACVQDGALDFVIANHVIEHCEDPIATLMTFVGKLRAGGMVFMAVPDMRRTFDKNRTQTTWKHLLADHTHGPSISRMQHFREWALNVENLTDDAAEQRAKALFDMGYSIHFHCWTRDGFQDFLDSAKQFAPLKVAEVKSWRNENIFMLEKVK